MKYPAILAACSAFALAVPAQAAIVVKPFSFTGSNFTLAFGDSSVAPIDPAYVSGSVTFDTSLDYNHETAGLTFTSNFPYTAEFAYNSAGDLFVLATNAFSNGCGNPSNSFCAFFNNFASSSPAIPYFFQQSTSTGGYYTASTIAASAPEPASWALMILGFGAIGGTLRRRQTVRIAYT